jgi:uncharacterized protein (TIGR00251 family)
VTFYRQQGENLQLFCLVQPKAACNEVVGIHEDRLKIRITAPPTEGKANAYLIRFFAHFLGIPRPHTSVQTGKIGRRKTVCITHQQQLPTELQLFDNTRQ